MSSVASSSGYGTIQAIKIGSTSYNLPSGGGGGVTMQEVQANSTLTPSEQLVITAAYGVKVFSDEISLTSTNSGTVTLKEASSKLYVNNEEVLTSGNTVSSIGGLSGTVTLSGDFGVNSSSNKISISQITGVNINCASKTATFNTVNATTVNATTINVTTLKSTGIYCGCEKSGSSYLQNNIVHPLIAAT